MAAQCVSTLCLHACSWCIFTYTLCIFTCILCIFTYTLCIFTCILCIFTCILCIFTYTLCIFTCNLCISRQDALLHAQIRMRQLITKHIHIQEQMRHFPAARMRIHSHQKVHITWLLYIYMAHVNTWQLVVVRCLGAHLNSWSWSWSRSWSWSWLLA